jgi:DNA polymerase I-like protein with 3'-5' exonuclease and polymerase domains
LARIINTADLTPEMISSMSEDDRYWTYNGLDICVTEEIRQALRPQLDNVTTSTYEFSRALQAPVLEMMLRGLLVNQARRSSVITDFEARLKLLEENLMIILREGVGLVGDFNWRSPAQLNTLLYDIMNLPEQRKRNSNGIMARASGREQLEKLTQYIIAEPVVNHLLALRDLGKSLGFLKTGIDPDGRMRTNINIAGTNTGRWSSSESDYGTGTNLQNVTSKLRSVFIADPGMKFCNMDLEQADSRNLGALCWESFVESMGEDFAGKYLDACEAGDLHTQVCKMCNPQLPWGTIKDREIADTIFYRGKSYRDASKVLGHGSNFLGQPVTMAKHTKFPVDSVRLFQANYFNAFPVIPKYHDNVAYQLANFASLTTLFGRRRFFFGRPQDAETLRAAVAYSPQSMTADEINTGILKLWRANKVQLLIQVHDSILFQYPEELENEIVPWALETLKAPLKLSRGRDFVVPTEAMTGWNWGYVNTDVNKGDLNPDGLKKWKGHDDRTRTEKDTRLSIRGL